LPGQQQEDGAGFGGEKRESSAEQERAEQGGLSHEV
jgi:hypothetical protein